MSPEAYAIFAAWSPPLGLTIATVLVAAVYARGWNAIRKTRPRYFTSARLACFLGGTAVLWIAIASPIDGFADNLLSVHMLQHFLLMSVVPPLLLLAAPVVPLLRALPKSMVRKFVGPVIALRLVRRIGDFVTAPAIAWLIFNVAFLCWHIPAAYDFALRNEHVHDMEHVCFLSTSLLFWYVVLHPWPSRVGRNSWGVLIFLLSADIVNTALSAFLVFCNRPIYAFYATGPNPFHVPPMADQMTAGALMWVLNSIVFLIPAMLLTVQLAGFDGRPAHRSATAPARTYSM